MDVERPYILQRRHVVSTNVSRWSVLGGCHILTLEVPLIAGKDPWLLYNGYIITLVETACRLCSCSSMRIIYCCPIQLGGEFSNYTGFLPPYSFPLPLPSSLPFSLSVLGGCQISTLEGPLITEKTPCIYNSYILYIAKTTSALLL
jgi:hypothetical protein